VVTGLEARVVEIGVVAIAVFAVLRLVLNDLNQVKQEIYKLFGR
jgi:hypothetical protein